MRIIKPQDIVTAVAEMCISANRNIPADVIAALEAGKQAEELPIACSILDEILENDRMAASEGLPACQDTGAALVFLDLGQDAHVDGNINDAVNEGVRQGYEKGYLRKSIVTDPLERVNSGDNTPAFIYLRSVPGDKLTITVAPKGFGSENMSRLAMLKPSDGEAGVRQFIYDTVRQAGPNACPPMVVGVGIGGSSDKAAEISKRALLRSLDSHHPVERYARMERELKEKINGTGIGPQGFGGRTTVLAVLIETMPTHIAGLPCAVTINCHCARHERRVL